MNDFNSQEKRRRASRRTSLMIPLLAALLLVQSAMIIHFGREKLWFHEDEIATFELANQPGGFLHLTDNFMETWKSGSFYEHVLTANRQTAFHYSIPYRNQEIDVHPPLYYFVIHTVSSLVPGTFSKWIGILPNILFALLSTLLLFAVAKRSFGNGIPAFITAAAWALGVGAMSMAVFIRMYSMLTFSCLLLVWLHARIAEEAAPLRWKDLLALLLCTSLGILTQYYFLIFCFFFCGSFFFYLALRKRWKDLWKYTAAEFGAIALSIFFFPEMLRHIFSGYRGKQAFRNMAGSKEYARHVREILTLISRELCAGWGKKLVLFLGVALLLYGVCRAVSIRKGARPSFSRLLPAQMWLPAASALTAAGYTLVVARIAPYQVDRYYLCLYPLIVLLMAHALLFVGKCFIKNEHFLPAVLALFLFALTAGGYRSQSVQYLYREYDGRENALTAYEHVPALILNETYAWAPDHWVLEYERLPAVYRCGKNDFSGLAQAARARDLTDGFLIYAVGMENRTEEDLFAEIEQYLQIEDRLLVSSMECRVYWCTLRET